MRSRPILLFILLLSTGYAASTSAYADEVAPYWDDQVMRAPETTTPVSLCISALALASMLLLRRGPGQRSGRRRHPDFDSETMVFTRAELEAADRQWAHRRAQARR